MGQRRERICFHELFKKNILQGFPGSVQGCAPLSAIPEAEDRQQCKGPAGSHSKEEMDYYLEIANRCGLLISGGSDFHGKSFKSDIELGTGKENNIRIKKNT